MAVIRLIIGEIKSKKLKISNDKIFIVFCLFLVEKFNNKPIIASKAKNWSGLPKSNTVNSIQNKKGTPIILPIKIMSK